MGNATCIVAISGWQKLPHPIALRVAVATDSSITVSHSRDTRSGALLCSLSDDGGFITQINQLVAICHRTKAVSGYDHGELTRKTAQRVEQLCFSRHV